MGQKKITIVVTILVIFIGQTSYFSNNDEINQIGKHAQLKSTSAVMTLNPTSYHVFDDVGVVIEGGDFLSSIDPELIYAQAYAMGDGYSLDNSSIVGVDYATFTIDDANVVHLAYSINFLPPGDTQNYGRIIYSTFSGNLDSSNTRYEGNWTNILVDEFELENNIANLRGKQMEIKHNSHGAHIVYLNSFEGSLNYANCVANTCEKTILDNNGTTGVFPSLEIDSQGDLHISYIELPSDQSPYGIYKLKYLNYNTSSTTITIQTVNELNKNSDYYRLFYFNTELIIDFDNHPSIIFSDSVNSARDTLKLAKSGVNGWSNEIIDPDESGHASAIYDENGTLHISYMTNGKGLKYALGTGNDWDLSTVVEHADLVYEQSPPSITVNDETVIILYKSSESSHNLACGRGGDNGFWSRNCGSASSFSNPEIKFNQEGDSYLCGIHNGNVKELKCKFVHDVRTKDEFPIRVRLNLVENGITYNSSNPNPFNQASEFIIESNFASIDLQNKISFNTNGIQGLDSNWNTSSYSITILPRLTWLGSEVSTDLILTIKSPLDSDGDGLCDKCNDAFPFDSTEISDFDGDGLGDNSDLDDDNDGLLDDYEIQIGTNPLSNDTDGDGVNDGADKFPLNSSESTDFDEDGIGDNTDDDDDNDGYPDVDELVCNSTANDNMSIPNDIDNDYLCDKVDDDIDGDGVVNLNDSFPLNYLEWNDLDKDNFGDNEDDCIGNYGTSTIDRLGCLDQDGDGVSDLNDLYPYDSSKSTESTDTKETSGSESKSSTIGTVFTTILVASIIGVVLFMKTGKFNKGRTNDLAVNQSNSSDVIENGNQENKDSIADSRLTVERPSKNLVGKIGEGGYEVIEYPENTGKWWWKDFENGEWNEWL